MRNARPSGASTDMRWPSRSSPFASLASRARARPRGVRRREEAAPPRRLRLWRWERATSCRSAGRTSPRRRSAASSTRPAAWSATPWPLATFTRYDTARDRWTTLPQLPEATRAAAAAAVDGVVYVVGGTTPAGNTRAVRAWDGKAWRPKAPLPSARFNHAAVAVGDRIWVLGGFAKARAPGRLRLRHPGRPVEPRDRPLPRPSRTFSAVALGKIWLLGGRRGADPARGRDPRHRGPRHLAARARDAEADGAPRRRGVRTHPRGLGERVPDVRRVGAPLAAGPAAARDAPCAEGLRGRRRALHRRQLRRRSATARFSSGSSSSRATRGHAGRGRKSGVCPACSQLRADSSTGSAAAAGESREPQAGDLRAALRRRVPGSADSSNCARP